jgi:pimeloyl-ACP methyl ester carboxylesterase
LRAAGGFGVNARAVVEEMDARRIERAVIVGHSHGGGVALSVAALAPERVEALVLLASVGPACLNGWDRLLAAPVTGEVCAVAAWWLTPWLARARLAAISRRRGRPIGARVRQLGCLGQRALRAREAVADVSYRAARSGQRTRRSDSIAGALAAASAAARRSPGHARPGRYHLPASGRLGGRPGWTAGGYGPSRSAPGRDPGRCEDHAVPGITG